MRQTDSIKEFMGMSLRELKGAIEDRTVHVTHSQHCQDAQQSQWHVTHICVLQMQTFNQ